MSKNILEQLSQISISKTEIESVIDYLTEVVDSYDELLVSYDDAINKLKELASSSKPEPKVKGSSIEEIQEIKDELISTHGPDMLVLRTFIQKTQAFKQIFED